MYNIYILNETFTNGYKAEVLDIISLVAILCGILVIISKNPIVSVLFLIGLFLSIASYLMILGLNFIGLSYLLVYIGAVSILFLFILMLINVRLSELLSNTSNSIPLAIFITISFYYLVYQILPYSITSFNSYTVYLYNTFNDIWYNNNSDYLNKFFKLNGTELDNGEISFVTSKIWDGNLAETSHITSIGNIMYTSYSIWLILTSIILLLAMIGAIVITINKNNVNYKYNTENMFRESSLFLNENTNNMNKN
jgi:NADH-ubiquinone oxidoreductase chain 6